MTVIGYAPGGYDMFHIGHLTLLRRAKAECDYLIAGVVTDSELTRVKGQRPVVPHHERLEIVRNIVGVDEAVTDPASDKLVIWQRLRFHVLFKGDDWRGTHKGATLEADLAAVGARVHYFPYTRHTSSTTLRRHLERQP